MNQHKITFNGKALTLLAEGALWDEAAKLVAVADLHMEKGSFLAAHGSPLPLYDTVATLEKLDTVIQKTQPQTVICLGDSFHDRNAEKRMRPEVVQALNALVASVPNWIWVLGNHDEHFPENIHGTRVPHYLHRGITFCHQEEASIKTPQLIGHYHPKAVISSHNKRVSGRCFAMSEQLGILPSFGAYTGGMYVTDPVIRQLMGEEIFCYYMLYKDKIYPFRCR